MHIGLYYPRLLCYDNKFFLQVLGNKKKVSLYKFIIISCYHWGILEALIFPIIPKKKF